MQGRCACGKITVTIPRPPEFINICNCRLCRSSGAAWGYFHPKEVQLKGETGRFRRNDLDPAVIDIFFCPACSSTSHYVLNETFEGPHDRMGVNTRLFAQDELEGVEVRYLDGRSVMSEEDEFARTGAGYIGDGKAF